MTVEIMTNSSREVKEDLFPYKELIDFIRSSDEEERKLTIQRIPNLLLAYFEKKNELVKQILLLIYNLNSDSEIFEKLTLSNCTIVIRHLLRLYMDTIRGEHKHDQVEALVKLVEHSNSSEMLIELTNALYHCLGSKKLDESDNRNIEGALDEIKEKSAANLYLDALLMIHSIMAIK